MTASVTVISFFFFNDTATTEIYTLSLHDALPILGSTAARLKLKGIDGGPHKRWSMWFNSTQRAEPYLGLTCAGKPGESPDRKSTRLNSSHANISYAVFCLKKKKNTFASSLIPDTP